MKLREKLESLRGAVKSIAPVNRTWKEWQRASESARARAKEGDERRPDGLPWWGPKKPDLEHAQPAWRATLLCTAIAHFRGKIHAHRYFDGGTERLIKSQDDQKKLLEVALNRIAEYDSREWYIKYPDRYRPPTLSADERKLIRIIVHEVDRRRLAHSGEAVGDEPQAAAATG